MLSWTKIHYFVGYVFPR